MNSRTEDTLMSEVMEHALKLVVDYDDLLRKFTGPVEFITAGDNAAIDAAYDKMVAAARAALSDTTPQHDQEDGR